MIATRTPCSPRADDGGVTVPHIDPSATQGSADPFGYKGLPDNERWLVTVTANIRRSVANDKNLNVPCATNEER